MSRYDATTTTNDRSRIHWTPLMERYFVDLMLEQKRRGNRVGHTFKKEAWIEMQKMLNTKFASEYDKDAMKLYYANLWNRFNDVKNILCHKDFTWDGSNEMVLADDEVWDAYIQVLCLIACIYAIQCYLYDVYFAPNLCNIIFN
ncbi:putative Myb/SANT-like domain-containing protein [Lupinus albus]|uniref:Putative Myb/SANT-like domain-containing protein n=1 Tax=Lupinus albus TaxID=3870 RepID=A0A6A4NII0_LUPAL|nr:putative Myb/SANT-like domain-containing protein [Lupinus albus]